MPYTRLGKNTISPADIEGTEIQLERVIYNGVEGEKKYNDWTVLSKANIPKVDASVPQMVIDYDLEINDLPYELKGWSDGQDLRKIDSVQLHNEVLDYYTKLRTILNDGKIQKFMDLTQAGTREIRIANYIKEKDAIQSDQESFEELNKECPGKMLPIKDYALRFYANGRLVKLERTDGDHRHLSVLIGMSDDEESAIGAILYKPIGSNSFEIIRN